jgi:apolipoprotein N-acyltransferase
MIIWVILGGAMMGLTPDPFGQWWWAWLALIPLWLFTQKVRPLTAFGLGGLWGIVYHGMALFWITGVHPMTWLGVSWWNSLLIAAIVWLIITLFGALLSGLWAFGMASLTPRLALGQKIIIACALFCALETCWSWTPLYWTALGYTQSPDDLLMLQISKLSGQQMVTATIVAVNGLLAEGLLSRDFRSYLKHLYYAFLVVGLVASYGFWELGQNLPATNLEPLSVGIIQGNIPNPIKLKEDGIITAINNYTKGYEELARSGVDMVLTPEVAIPLRYPDPDTRREKLDRAIYTYGVPIWLGAFGNLTGDDYTNSLFLVNGVARKSPPPFNFPFNNPFSSSVDTLNESELNARLIPEPISDPTPQYQAQYNKVRLVPVGEYIPFKEIIGNFIRRLSPLRGEVVAGARDQLVDSPWGRMILGICYESAYPEHFRYQAQAGGRLILTASNNAHYAESMPAQHHAQDVARAVETDRWAVRATNTGYSGIIDPKGRTIWRSGINTYEIHQDTVYLRDTQTLFVLVGDWLTPLLCLLSSFICFGNAFRKNDRLT